MPRRGASDSLTAIARRPQSRHPSSRDKGAIMTATSISSDHAHVVADLYAAFGHGDLEGVLAPLADDVTWDADWSDNFMQRAGVDLAKPRHGIAGVREFFSVFAVLRLHHFQV